MTERDIPRNINDDNSLLVPVNYFPKKVPSYIFDKLLNKHHFLSAEHLGFEIWVLYARQLGTQIPNPKCPALQKLVKIINPISRVVVA